MGKLKAIHNGRRLFVILILRESRVHYGTLEFPRRSHELCGLLYERGAFAQKR